jgi:hypothetical protein
LNSKHRLDLFFEKELSRNFGTFRRDDYGKKKKCPIQYSFLRLMLKMFETLWAIIFFNMHCSKCK